VIQNAAKSEPNYQTLPQHWVQTAFADPGINRPRNQHK